LRSSAFVPSIGIGGTCRERNKSLSRQLRCWLLRGTKPARSESPNGTQAAAAIKTCIDRLGGSLGRVSAARPQLVSTQSPVTGRANFGPMRSLYGRNIGRLALSEEDWTKFVRAFASCEGVYWPLRQHFGRWQSIPRGGIGALLRNDVLACGLADGRPHGRSRDNKSSGYGLCKAIERHKTL
jgi:hypothetical protein